MENNGKKSKAQARGKSTTLEVLGGVAPAGRVSSKWWRQQATLSGLRDRLLQNRRNQSEEAKEEMTHFSLHVADAGTDSYDRDWMLAMVSSTQSLLYEVDQALNRIRNGTYGICEWTGESIEPERLNAIPWARFSKRAQIELEAKSSSGRIQLGELGSYQAAEGGGTEPDSGWAEESEREAA